MKRIVALLLAVAMLATLGLSAFAAETEQELNDTKKSGTADVYTTEGEEWWVVQIPANQAIAWGAKSDTNMGYKVASQLKEGKGLSVTVAALTETLVQQNTGATHAEIAYTSDGLDTAAPYGAINGSKTVSDGATTYNYVDKSNVVVIHVAADAFSQKPIDKYSVTLTYTVEVTEAD